MIGLKVLVLRYFLEEGEGALLRKMLNFLESLGFLLG